MSRCKWVPIDMCDSVCAYWFVIAINANAITIKQLISLLYYFILKCIKSMREWVIWGSFRVAYWCRSSSSSRRMGESAEHNTYTCIYKIHTLLHISFAHNITLPLLTAHYKRRNRVWRSSSAELNFFLVETSVCVLCCWNWRHWKLNRALLNLHYVSISALLHYCVHSMYWCYFVRSQHSVRVCECVCI